MLTLMVEPGGLYFDLENKMIAAIKPRPAFLPILRMLNGVVEYEEANGLIVTERWQERNRRAMNHRSHLALIPLEKLFSGRGDLLLYINQSTSLSTDSPGDPFEKVLENPLVMALPQRYPGPDALQWKIPPCEWPTVLRRVDQGEPLRQVARDYAVSYETVRRVVRATRKLRGTE